MLDKRTKQAKAKAKAEAEAKRRGGGTVPPDTDVVHLPPSSDLEILDLPESVIGDSAEDYFNQGLPEGDFHIPTSNPQNWVRPDDQEARYFGDPTSRTAALKEAGI